MLTPQPDVPGRFIVRPAEPQDAKDIWSWRNEPVTRENSGNAAPIPWADHVAWFSAVLDDPERVIYMVMPATADGAKRGESIAVVRFDRVSQVTGCWRVSLNLRSEARGLGLGRQVLLSACQVFFDANGTQMLQAEIQSRNVASRRVFSALGFARVNSPGPDGLDLYERPTVSLPKPSDLRGS